MRTSSDTTRLRDDLLALVRKRVPASDAEDVVQSTLMEALAAKGAPSEHEPFRKFAFGVAKNKIADYYRRSKRETLDEAPDAESPPENHEGRSLLHWAEERLPNAESKKTFGWMLREGDGEKLETIAEDESVPAPRIRKRVSRLREHLRAHWKHEVALLAALGVASLVFFILRGRKDPDIVEDTPRPVPQQTEPERLAEPIRNKAHNDCAAGRFVDCLEGLDRARVIDPAGDSKPGVAADRRNALDALNAPRAAPTTSLQKTQTPQPSYAPSPKMLGPKAAPATPAKPGPPKPQPSKTSASFSSSELEFPSSNIVSKEGPPARQQVEKQFLQQPSSDVPSLSKSAPRGSAKK